MGITKFLYILFIISTIFLFYKVQNNAKIVKSEKKPLIFFEDAISYDISQKGITRIVEFKKMFIYDGYEKSLDTTVILRDDKNSTTNILSANKILKVEDRLTLIGNVHLLNDEYFNLETEELQYNLKTKLLKNSTKFTVQKDGSVLKGEKLYYDTLNSNMEASQAHFKIKLKDKNETK